MKKKYKQDDFFNFMSDKIWPQITGYIDEHAKDKDFRKDFDNGHVAFIFAYGDEGMACCGTHDALYQRLGNIMLHSLKVGFVTMKELTNLCNGVIKEYSNGTEKV